MNSPGRILLGVAVLLLAVLMVSGERWFGALIWACVGARLVFAKT